MTTRERQELVIRAAARVQTARMHLATASSDLDQLCVDIGIRHHSATAVKLALRETESAETITSKLVETLELIERNNET